MNNQTLPTLSVPYIAWEVQLTCNMGCPFCYSSSYNRFRRDETRDRLALDKVLAGLDALRAANLGIEYINWTGGEPLLQHDRLPAIFRRSRELGFRNILSTNCMFSALPGLGDREDRELSNARFDTYLRELEPVLDWLAISWDSADPAVNNEVMRLRPDRRAGSPLHYADVTAFLDLYRREGYQFGLKVNTVVTAKNCGPAILEIGSRLHALDCIWKLVQFNPRECLPEERIAHEVRREEFLELSEQAKDRYLGSPDYEGLRIAVRTYDGSTEPYCILIVNTSGQILLPKGEKHIPVASLYDGGDGATAPDKLRRTVAENLAIEMRQAAAFRSAGGAILPLDIFSAKNRQMLDSSYPSDMLPDRQLRHVTTLAGGERLGGFQ